MKKQLTRTWTDCCRPPNTLSVMLWNGKFVRSCPPLFSWDSTLCFMSVVSFWFLSWSTLRSILFNEDISNLHCGPPLYMRTVQLDSKWFFPPLGETWSNYKNGGHVVSRDSSPSVLPINQHTSTVLSLMCVCELQAGQWMKQLSCGLDSGILLAATYGWTPGPNTAGPVMSGSCQVLPEPRENKHWFLYDRKRMFKSCSETCFITIIPCQSRPL